MTYCLRRRKDAVLGIQQEWQSRCWNRTWCRSHRRTTTSARCRTRWHCQLSSEHIPSAGRYEAGSFLQLKRRHWQRMLDNSWTWSLNSPRSRHKWRSKRYDIDNALFHYPWLSALSNCADLFSELWKSISQSNQHKLSTCTCRKRIGAAWWCYVLYSTSNW